MTAAMTESILMICVFGMLAYLIYDIRTEGKASGWIALVLSCVFITTCTYGVETFSTIAQ
jgi:hypothetical protein